MASWLARPAVLGAIISSTFACATAPKIDPEGSDKRYYLGADYFGKKQYRPAQEELEKALELNPRNVDAHYLLGLLSLQQASDTETMIERASCVGGEEARLERQEADVQFKKAEAEFKTATEIEPTLSDAWNAKAVVELHFQQWDEAISATDKALTNGSYRQPWAAQGNLGWALYQKKEYLRASKELRTALFSNPQFCVGRYRLAKVFYDQQNFDGAAEELEKVTSDPKCPLQEALLLSGLVSLKRNDREHAVEMFRRCVALAPKSCLSRQCRIAD